MLSIKVLHGQRTYNFWCSTLEKSIKEAYRWLSVKYQEGDRIFLFGRGHVFSYSCTSLNSSGHVFGGFSRGAYTARALAGMLHKVGHDLSRVAA